VQRTTDKANATDILAQVETSSKSLSAKAQEIQYHQSEFLT
jgi:hypothetical protein